MTFLSQTATAPVSARGSLPSLRTWLAVARERRALARLDDERLHDLGLTRREALQEASRSFWDIPAHRSEN